MYPIILVDSIFLWLVIHSVFSFTCDNIISRYLTVDYLNLLYFVIFVNIFFNMYLPKYKNIHVCPEFGVMSLTTYIITQDIFYLPRYL